jgi:hypothetical protein
MPKMSDNPSPSLLFEDHVDPAAPSDGFHRLFIDTDEKLKMIDHASLVTDFTPGGGGAPTTTPYVTTALDAGLSAEVVIPGLAGSPDIRAGGAEDDEFDQNSAGTPSGWTAFGSPTAMDTNTAKSHLHIKMDANATDDLRGVYKAYTPSFPFTLTAKATGATAFQASFNAIGIYVAEATPGKLSGIQNICNTASIAWPRLVYRRVGYTNLTTTATETRLNWTGAVDPFYLRIVATNSTTLAYKFSHDGLVWITVESAVDPGFTIGAIVLAISPENNTYGVEAFYDWIRIS